MTARIIDGKVIASELRAHVAEEVARVKRDHQLTPGLAVVLVGEDPASAVYVRNKVARTEAAGMRSFVHRLPATASATALLDRIAADVEPKLPIAIRVHEASLFVDDHGGQWSEHGRLPLGQSGVA